MRNFNIKDDDMSTLFVIERHKWDINFWSIYGTWIVDSDFSLEITSMTWMVRD